MKKIAVITGTRAEYGLLKPLIDLIHKDNFFELQIVATAMHLSAEYGYTINEIESDGFFVNKKIDCLLGSDTAVGVTKSIGLALISFAEVFDELSPDIVVILGDRSEMLAAATAACVTNIPIAHISGGETTEGAYDEAFRHSISKMSYLHFTSTDVYRQRVIQLGESSERVFNVGAISIDSINQTKLLSKEEFEESINFKIGSKTAIVTYHPVTLENSETSKDFEEILKALSKYKDLKLIFTHANSDKEGKQINEMIVDFVRENSVRATEIKSLGQRRYFSALKHVNVVIGNSSSGIVEASYFNVPTINVGDRQKGRLTPFSVLNVKPKSNDIYDALKKSFSDDFSIKIEKQEQIYGEGNVANRIIDILKKTKSINLKKRFIDLNS